MFVVKWFYDILNYLGFGSKKARILFLGLDNAGKSTLLGVLGTGRLSVHEPTRHPQFEEMTVGNVHFQTHDLGGHAAARRLWKSYFLSVEGVVFLIDASDSKRFDESKKELDQLLECEDLAQVPFLILGNKIDLEGAISETELKKTFELTDRVTGKTPSREKTTQRPLEVFNCSIVKRVGYIEGFQWLSKNIK